MLSIDRIGDIMIEVEQLDEDSFKVTLGDPTSSDVEHLAKYLEVSQSVVLSMFLGSGRIEILGVLGEK